MKEKTMTRKNWRWLALLIFVPLPLWGQQKTKPAKAGRQTQPPSTSVTLQGSSAFTTPSPEGIVGPLNLLSFGTDVSTGYDDNVRQTNVNRVAAMSYAISPRLTLNRVDGRFAMRLRYQPTLFFYQRQSAFNEQDHDLNFDATFHSTDRLTLRAQTNIQDRRGLLSSPSGMPSGQITGSPGLLNNTVATPFANEFEDNSRADISYAVSPRAAIGVFATYMWRSFGKSAASSESPFSTEGESAGLRYAYRTGARTTIGLTYLNEHFHTGKGMDVGLNTISIDWTLAVTPRLKLNASVGPTDSSLRGNVLVPFAPSVSLSVPIDRQDWHWTSGAGFSYETTGTSLRMNGSRQVTDGGGLLDAVTSDAAQGSFERRLSRLWTIQLSAGWQRNVDLAGPTQPGQLDGEYGRILFLHPISAELSAGVGYLFERQRATGILPPGTNFDRDFAYFTLSYRIRNFPLGW